jgi:hypothetical protein
MATQEERPRSLEEKIAVLKNRIAAFERAYDAAAVTDGSEAMQISLLATITECRISLRGYEQERRLGQQQSQPATTAPSLDGILLFDCHLKFIELFFSVSL